jgi:hypothetical protein
VTLQGDLQSGQQIQALLAQGRQIAADAAIRRRSRFAAEGPRDFLLDFDHLHNPLRLVIVKWHDEAMQEGQHGLLLGAQAVQQVAGRTLFGASFGAGGTASGWFLVASRLLSQQAILVLKLSHFFFGHAPTLSGGDRFGKSCRKPE